MPRQTNPFLTAEGFAAAGNQGAAAENARQGNTLISPNPNFDINNPVNLGAFAPFAFQGLINEPIANEFGGSQFDPLGLFNQGGGQQNADFVFPQQVPFLQNLFGNAQQVQQGTQQGLNQFSQQTLPQLFQQGQQGQQQLGQLGQQTLGDNALLNSQASLNNFSNQSALQGQIGNLGENLGQFFNEQLLPGIDARSQVAGQQRGSARNNVALGQGIRDTANAFSRGAVDLTSQFGQQQIQAAQAGGALRLGQLGLGGQQLGQANDQISGLANLGISQFTAPFAALQQLAQIIGDPTVLGGGGQTQGGGLFGGGGGGGAIGGILGGIFSDERLKRDIEQISETAAGQPVYKFRYLWSDLWYIGVMAQESPDDAVIEHPSGYLMVDYGKIH